MLFISDFPVFETSCRFYKGFESFHSSSIFSIINRASRYQSYTITVIIIIIFPTMTKLNQFTKEEAQITFLEATGSWANIWEKPYFEPILSHEMGCATGAFQSEESVVLLKTALQAYRVSALGFHSFVVPYERYKKGKTRHYEFDASELFGLDKYSTSDPDSLEEDFPNTAVLEWNPSRSPPKSTWFADMMRNSIAHSQTETTTKGGQSKVALCNTQDGVSMNFHIIMDAQEFISLVASSLSKFVREVVAGGRVEPLSTLLDHVAPRQGTISSRSLQVNPIPQTSRLPGNPRPQILPFRTQRDVAQPVSVTGPGGERDRRSGKQNAMTMKKYYLKAYNYFARKR